MDKIEMIGKQFGRLTVIAESKSHGAESRWICKCECGVTTKPIRGSSLRRGATRSCGCLQKEIVRERITKHPPHYHTTHNESYSRLYKVWQGMKSRCTNPNSTSFQNYGGRGIAVCAEWLNDFQAFYDWAMSNGYEPAVKRGKCTIDRIDVNGDYCPENCRFVSMKEQNSNKRKSNRSAK